MTMPVYLQRETGPDVRSAALRFKTTTSDGKEPLLEDPLYRRAKTPMTLSPMARRVLICDGEDLMKTRLLLFLLIGGASLSAIGCAARYPALYEPRYSRGYHRYDSRDAYKNHHRRDDRERHRENEYGDEYRR